MTTRIPHTQPTSTSRAPLNGGPKGEHDHPEDDRSLGQILSDVAHDAQRLMRAELDMAKEEMSAKAKNLARYVAMGAAAGLLGAAAILLIGHFLAQALGTFMPDWVAYLLVTLVYLAAAAGLALKAKEGFKQEGAPVPNETINNAKEDVSWVKNQI